MHRFKCMKTTSVCIKLNNVLLINQPNQNQSHKIINDIDINLFDLQFLLTLVVKHFYQLYFDNNHIIISYLLI